MKQSGFTYIGLLIVMACMAIVAGTSVTLGAVMQRRAAEEELLRIGAEYRAGILSYLRASPGGAVRYPTSLQELVRDPRYPFPLRHLRQIYADPLSGETDWGLLKPKGGNGIAGVYSKSLAKPIKVGNFEPVFAEFTNASRYRDWWFSVLPREQAQLLEDDVERGSIVITPIVHGEPIR